MSAPQAQSTASITIEIDRPAMTVRLIMRGSYHTQEVTVALDTDGARRKAELLLECVTKLMKLERGITRL